MRLTILHTNDIHSNYENFARVVTKIKELKDENTLILDAGDFADFKRIELQGTYGLAAMELLDYAGYDALTIGNNEAVQGIEILRYMAENSKVPLLSSNLGDLNQQKISNVKGSIVMNKKGLDILIIGAYPGMDEFDEMFGFCMEDYLASIQKEINDNQGKYDLCILLSHLGMNKDKVVAESISGIDIIIGGHFHILMEQPEIVNKTIIFTSGSFAEHIGKLVVDVDQGKVELIEGNNINVLSCMEDEKVLAIIQNSKEIAIDNLSQAFCIVDRDIWHDLVEENPMTNLLADALKDLYECDMGIINSGVLQGGIKKGKVSRLKMIEICPSPLNPTRFEIQGKDLWEALQQSMDTDFCFSDGRGAGFRGKYLGRLHVSNAVIEHDGRHIKTIFINGEELIPDKWYKVASSDYLHRGTGYQTLANNRNEVYKKEFLRDVIQDYVVKEEFVEKASHDRWILKS